MEITANDILVMYPLVSEDAPDWKRTCPFCGEYGAVHEVGDTYVCHWCHANWIEHDTETERQIQILALNDGKMPRFGEGEMPLVERTFNEKFTYTAVVNLEDSTVKFLNDKMNCIAEIALDDADWTAFFREGKNHGKRASGF